MGTVLGTPSAFTLGMNNYRLIAVSIIDGTTYDVAEFVNFAEVITHAKAITRWDVHCFCVALCPERPYAMATLIETGRTE
jgi:hypothetical protein